MRSNVDFPQPDGPTKTTNSPSRMYNHVAQDGYIAVRLAYTGQFHICHIASP